MRIYSDVLTADDVHDAMRLARAEHGQDIYGEVVQKRGRKRAHSIELHCDSLHGRRLVNSGRYGAGQYLAASWAAWGYVIAELFRRDPAAIVGQYEGVDDFIAQCEAQHSYHQRFHPNRHDYPGEDASFLALVSGVASR